jgi:hypothetical protein
VEENLRFEGIEANEFLKMMERAGAPLNIVILGGKTFKRDYREGKVSDGLVIWEIEEVSDRQGGVPLVSVKCFRHYVQVAF